MTYYITLIITSLVSSLVTIVVTKMRARIKRLYAAYKPKSLSERIREEVERQLKDIIND
jgi:hypothetical protein